MEEHNSQKDFSINEVFNQIFNEKYQLALVKNKEGENPEVVWNNPSLLGVESKITLPQKIPNQKTADLADLLNNAVRDFSKCDFSKKQVQTIKEKHGNYLAFGFDKDQFVVAVKKDASPEKVESEKTKVLLKDMHHRVKNHLQIVCSMVDLDCSKASNQDIFEVADRIRDRIQVLAKLHETLYKAEELEMVNISSYLSKIAADLSSSYDASVSIAIDVEDIYLDLNRALDCGLIVSELVSNAFKHGFADNRKGTISIDGHLIGDIVQIRVQNSGIPINTDYDPLVDESRGLQLVTLLTKQLDGKIFFSRNPKTSFKIQFHIQKN